MIEWINIHEEIEQYAPILRQCRVFLLMLE